MYNTNTENRTRDATKDRQLPELVPQPTTGRGSYTPLSDRTGQDLTGIILQVA